MKQIIFMSPDEIKRTADRLLYMLGDRSLVVDILLDEITITDTGDNVETLKDLRGSKKGD